MTHIHRHDRQGQSRNTIDGVYVVELTGVFVDDPNLTYMIHMTGRSSAGSISAVSIDGALLMAARIRFT
jgi:hypothetical protein